MNGEDLFYLLMLISGVLWTATYVLIIRQGLRDRTYGMPFAALCANLAWEFIFSCVLPHGSPQRVVNFVWLAFDLVIAAQVLRYGPREWRLPRGGFHALFGVSLIVALGAVLTVTLEFDNTSGSYAAFGQNLMMSALFVAMLLRRRTLAGQSLAIGVCKLLGTLVASSAFFLLTREGSESLLLPFLYVSILLFDGLYVALVWQRTRNERSADNHRQSVGRRERAEECACERETVSGGV